MNMAQLLKTTANAARAATVVKGAASDIVRQMPYSAMGAAMLLGALAGILVGRRQRSG
jgi:ElaB/YqjD/DUF883 family membrane-anchored ribosome-binding protein